MHTALKTHSWLQMVLQRSIATENSMSALADKVNNGQETTLAGLKVRRVQQRHPQECEC